MKRGIDVSSWQGVINWSEVRASGVEWCMVKAMQGTRPADRFEENLTGAYRAGLVCGVYHYVTASTPAEGKTQVQALLAELARYRPLIKLYVALDIEDKALPKDKDVLADMVWDMYHAVEDAGYKAIVYTNPAWLRERLDDISGLRLWLAWWRKKEQVPNLTDYPNLRLWQWGTDSVPGVKGPVDCNLMVAEDPVQERVPEPHLDNTPADWAAEAVKWSVDSGLLKGNERGDLMLHEPVTREQMVVLLWRLRELLK